MLDFSPLFNVNDGFSCGSCHFHSIRVCGNLLWCRLPFGVPLDFLCSSYRTGKFSAILPVLISLNSVVIDIYFIRLRSKRSGQIFVLS